MGQENAKNLGQMMERLTPAPTGIGVFEIEDGSGLWEVGGYFMDQPDEIALSLLAASFNANPFAVSKIPPQDWVAKVRRELSPITAGRFFVYGSHDADKVPPKSAPLLIEAAMAFGTGHHGTTLGCLRAFDRLLGQGHRFDRPLDLGCGTAVLAMAAARVCSQKMVWASDIDPVAVDVARANVQANDLDAQVKCILSEGFADARLQKAAPFDLIFANILKMPLIMLAPDIRQYTRVGGILILSGILKHQAAEVIEVYERLGFTLEFNETLDDWAALTLKRK